MAKARTRLSAKAKLVQAGYGQVEGNKLSSRYNGGIFAQLPVDSSIAVLENGMFARYDYAKGKVDMDGEGEWMLVFNEVKVYEPGQTDADFAMLKENYGGYYYNAVGEAMPEGTTMVPRLFQTRVGDIFTTNCIKSTYGPEETQFAESVWGESGELKVGAKLQIDTDGYLKPGEPESGMVWVVVKKYTMPDGQPGVKIMRLPDKVAASE